MWTKKKAIFARAVAAFAAVFLGAGAYRMATATKTCTQRIVFKKMPADDGALTDWLRAQPGVLNTEVTRDANTLIASFAMAASGNDPEPMVLKAAVDQFGYGGWESTSVTWKAPRLLPWGDD